MLKFFPFTLFYACCAIVCSAQTQKLRVYNEQDGLGSRFVNTISQDDQGYLIIGTSEGLYKYNGFAFQSFTTTDSLADNFIECSLKDSKGRIFIGHNNGTISLLQGNKFSIIHLEKYLTSKIVALVSDRSDNIYAVSQSSGICILDAQLNVTHIQEGLEEYNLFSASYDHQNRLWLGTDMGMVMASRQNNKFSTDLLNGIPVTTIACINSDKNGDLLIGTDDAGLFKFKCYTEEIDTLFTPQLDLATLQIRHVSEDENGQLLLCTNNQGIIALSNKVGSEYTRIRKFNDLASPAILSAKTTFIDRENIVWIGSVGNGLVKLEQDYFTNYDLNAEKDPSIFGIIESQDTLYLGGLGSIHICVSEPANVIKTIGKESGLPSSAITALLRSEQMDLYAGTLESGLWKQTKGKGKFKRILLSEDFINQKINSIIEHNQVIYVATDYGAYLLQNDKVIRKLSIESGLSGNTVRTIFKDSQNRIWIGTTTSEISFLDAFGNLKQIESPITNSTLPVRQFAEDVQGNIWMATEGDGVIKLAEEGTRAFQKAIGLYSNYCYSLIYDDQNNLWVGHRGALSKINIKNEEITVLSPFELGQLSCSESAVTRLSGGILLFGTTSGVLKYNPLFDKRNELEPILHITSVSAGDSTFVQPQSIQLPYGDYKMVFDFVGISLKQSDGVRYQYILEGYDTDWSEPEKDHTVTYNHLGPGNYTFKVKAFNADGFGGQTIKEITFTIAQPFWLKWWFIAAVIAFLLGLARVIILRRERQLKANQEYLKKELAERTKEVVEQKELLEIKNKDITDSIVYAKNIQNAFMPSYNELKGVFHDAFVYFKPRDIVSGDFYWVHRSDSIVQIACGDCTGHGVPGAFMSLIGSRILQDVSAEAAPNDPAQFLKQVNIELNEVFKQGTEVSTLNDGMDLALVSYDSTTRLLKYAGANRPIFVFHQNQLLEIKGDRRPIGGKLTNNVESNFSNHELYLNQGDIIYLFSDGITDQFGGPFGKKIKKKGFKSWIENMAHKPIDEQRDELKDNFKKWRGALEQLDDIIVIAIQI